MSQRPLVIAAVDSRPARTALRRLDLDCSFANSIARLHKRPPERSPRMFLIQADRGGGKQVADMVRLLRQQRPLTDVVIWSPQASASAVRHWFRAGVKDVCLSASIDKLVATVQQVLSDQQILSYVDDLAAKRVRSARFESMLSRSDAMWDIFDLCTRIAPAEATVLIAGQTGTGKELLARAIHRRSGRKGRFVAANCAGISTALINSELFGHEKGAFTGADRSKKGLVVHADKGTLFLDEIGDMPPEGQLSLLRMLQEKRIRPVGGLAEIEIDVRVVAATNVSLDEAVREGRFREDLFYRLDVIRMTVPTLQERPEDILFLFGHFAKRLAKHYGIDTPLWTDEFLDALLGYEWPGNVRQLENFSERLVLARPQRALTEKDFQRFIDGKKQPASTMARRSRDSAKPEQVDLSRPLTECAQVLVEKFEREYLEGALRENRGRIIDTARQAGISRRTLLRKLNRYDLDKSEFKQTS